MFAVLRDAIDEVDIPVDGAALAEVIALRDRLDARIAAAVGEFDHAQMWDVDSATSMTAWLRFHAKRTPAAAARLTTTARRLRALPATAAAWRNGTVSTGHVEAIMANVDDELVGRFAEHEAGLLPHLAHLTVSQAANAMRHWRACAEAERDHREPREFPQALHVSRTLGGRHEISGHVDGEGAYLLTTALALADSDDLHVNPATRRAEALAEICRFFLDHRDHQPGNRQRPHLNLIIDTETGRATTLDGLPIDPTTLQRLLCDATVRRVLTAGSIILDYGSATRTVPLGLWNAVVLRDRHCRFPGCDRPASWTEAHHVKPVSEFGPTALDNLCLLCSRHHHRIHQPGWHAKLLPDGTFELTDPRGRVQTTHPPGPLELSFNPP